MQLERMDAFFAARLAEYDAHMRTNIVGAEAFYRLTAALLPQAAGTTLLDLGCGTGLELEAWLPLCPDAAVTGIDLSQPMLDALAAKFPGHTLRLLCASYLDVELGEAAYDAAVSVESLHHFPAAQKLPLYRKLLRALRPGGLFVLTDYFAADEAQEQAGFAELARLKREQRAADGALYHFDTPLTVDHEMALLRQAGFADVCVRGQWAATCTVTGRRGETEVGTDG